MLIFINMAIPRNYTFVISILPRFPVADVFFLTFHIIWNIAGLFELKLRRLGNFAFIISCQFWVKWHAQMRSNSFQSTKIAFFSKPPSCNDSLRLSKSLCSSNSLRSFLLFSIIPVRPNFIFLDWPLRSHHRNSRAIKMRQWRNDYITWRYKHKRFLNRT